MRNNIKKLFFLLAVVTLCAACHSRRVYTGVIDVPTQGWNADSALCFTFDVTEAQEATEWVVFVRHNTNYRFQNFWIFLDVTTPDGAVKSDTVECYLADQRGRWLGNGWGALREMPILWHDKEALPEVGTYTLKVKQGMRTEQLKGIASIGLEIKKNK